MFEKYKHAAGSGSQNTYGNVILEASSGNTEWRLQYLDEVVAETNVEI